MKNLKNYYEFMDESSRVPYTIVQYNLSKNKWIEDKELIKKIIMILKSFCSISTSLTPDLETNLIKS